MTQANIHLRRAVPEDVPALRELIDKSVRGLQTEDYTTAQIEVALQPVFGVDSQLIADGTYIVAEAERNAIPRAEAARKPSGLIIVGCGGWSKRKTLYGSDRWTGREDALLDPQRDAAKIRAFFLHPDLAPPPPGDMILAPFHEAAQA